MWKSSGQESTDDAIDAERERVKADGVVEKKVEQKTRREEREISRRQKRPKSVEIRAGPSHTTHR